MDEALDSLSGPGGMEAEPSAQFFGLKAQRIVAPPAEPPIVTGIAQRVSHTREASVEITGPAFNSLGYKSPDPLSWLHRDD